MSLIHENFLLHNDFARKLYHDFAAKMPIIDYHNHLPPDQVLGDKNFANLSEAWLHGDHYKWRAMRTNGVNEAYCTGNKSDFEKFEKWAATVPYTMRNPLYHWTHLELKHYFGISDLLNERNAKSVYENCTEQLGQQSHSVRNLLKNAAVKTICTTDDPLDSLEHHIAYRVETESKAGEVKMLPAFRPDKFILIESSNYNLFIEKLAGVAGTQISTFEDLKNALKIRALFFKSNGCKISDHGLEKISAGAFTEEQANAVFIKKLQNAVLSDQEIEIFKSAILIFLGKMYHELGWVQQFHLGAMRNNNLRAVRTLGPDTGWDSIGDYSQASSLSRFLGALDEHNTLAKTIIYNLNPSDNAIMATMLGNFNDGSVAGKVQWGSGWWFLDQKDGMETQINVLSNMGLLSKFVGMLTDSRSFLSFPRHEYFRRILCQMLGKDIENGELPTDLEFLGKMVQDICYNNAKDYFDF